MQFSTTTWMMSFFLLPRGACNFSTTTGMLQFFYNHVDVVIFLQPRGCCNFYTTTRMLPFFYNHADGAIFLQPRGCCHFSTTTRMFPFSAGRRPPACTTRPTRRRVCRAFCPASCSAWTRNAARIAAPPRASKTTASALNCFVLTPGPATACPIGPQPRALAAGKIRWALL